MSLNIGGNLIVGKVERVKPTPVRSEARNIKDLVADQLEALAAAEAAREIEERNTVPVDGNRPIFNSLIDNKESSRYILDMMK